VNQELLEALQAMLRMTERHAPPGLSPTPGSPIALARAAIARAVEEKLRAKNSTLACIPAVPPV
jgi:hypothetical protein